MDIREAQEIKESVAPQVGGGKEKNNKPLNDRQVQFCLEYIANSGNGRQAAIKAGYKEATANDQARLLLKDSRVSSYIKSKQAKLHTAILKDRNTFLTEVEELKTLCRESKRIGELIKLMSLEASVLGIDKKEVASTTNNIFASVDAAKSFLLGNSDTNAIEPPLHMGKLEIVDSSHTTTQINDIQDAPQDVVCNP